MLFLKKYLIYKKFPHLYFDDYKDYKIIFNLQSNDHSLVLLDEEQLRIFNLIDGKLNIAGLIKKLKDQIPKDYVIDTLRYLLHRNIIHAFNFEKKVSKSPGKNHGMSLEVASACNLACDYCFVNTENGKLLTFETGKKYIEKIFEIQMNNKVKEFGFRFTGGEPLLNLDTMVKLVEFANKNAKQYKIKNLNFEMVTNGTLIDKNTAKIIKKLNIKTVLSLDGLKEYCDSRKYADGSRSFNDIIKGYNHLKSEGVEFSVNIVINHLNTKGEH